MSETTKLSLTGGSGLPMSTLLECPRKFKLIADGWRRKHTPIYFIDGAIFHYAADHIIRGTAFKSTADVEKLCEVYDHGEFYDERKEKMITFDHTELAYPNKKLKNGEPSPVTKAEHSKKKMVHLLLQVHIQKAAGSFNDVEDTESYHETQVLIDPVTGNPDDEAKRIQDAGLVYCGRLDIAKKDGTVEDLKTTKKLGGLARIYSNQLAIYGYLHTIQTGNVTERVGIHAFKKNVTKCEYEYESLPISIDTYKDTFEELKLVGREFIECSKSDKWPKRGHLCSGCRDKWGQLCDMHPLCFSDQYGGLDKAKETLVRDN